LRWRLGDIALPVGPRRACRVTPGRSAITLWHSFRGYHLLPPDRGESMNAQLKPTGFPLPSSLRVVPGTERAQAA
jgi:hypothetical protein